MSRRITMKDAWKGILPTLYQRVNVQTLKEFIHRCADDISGRKPPQFESMSSIGWSNNEFVDAVLHSKLFLVEAVSQNYDSQMIESAFPTLDKQLITAICNCVNVRNNELKESLLAIAATMPGTKLVDFDWKLKWVLGSSSLSTLQEPLLCVNLHLATKPSDSILLSLNGNCLKQSTFNIELNSSELDTLISALENVEGSPQREF